jgi:signal transduction histidine kinase
MNITPEMQVKLLKEELAKAQKYIEELEKTQESLIDANVHIAEIFEHLEESYQNVELLSKIGKEITSTLDFDIIFDKIYQSINKLMDATVFGIGIYKPEKESIEYKLAISNGKKYLPYSRSMAEKNQFPVWCIEKKTEIFINNVVEEYSLYISTYEDGDKKLEDGSTDAKPQSLIYVPLMVADKILGIITVQSFKKNAYTKIHLDFLRNIAAYSAIALENAHAYAQIEIQKHELLQQQQEAQQLNEELISTNEELISTLDHLKSAQNQLIVSEKIAALGKLVSGVAHEINTPLGAIRASMDNLSVSIRDNFMILPLLMNSVSIKYWALFFEFLMDFLKPHKVLSVREERQTKRKLAEKLSKNNITDYEHFADRLIDMKCYEIDEKYLALWTHPEASKLLEASYNFSSMVRNCMNAQQAVDRAAKIVFALKIYAKRDQSSEKRPVNLHENIETVLTLYQNLLKYGVEVIRDFNLISDVLCFPEELQQVWTNLIHNAIQAMKNKGTLRISIYQEKNHVFVEMEDTGGGVPEHYIDKIFEPFFTTKPEGEGTGLGLSICKQIIEKHLGHITVKNGQEGAIFKIELPIE